MGIPLDYNAIFPSLHGYLIRPLLVSPPMCTLRELQDGTYNIADLETIHQILDLKEHMKPKPAPENPLLAGVM